MVYGKYDPLLPELTRSMLDSLRRPRAEPVPSTRLRPYSLELPLSYIAGYRMLTYFIECWLEFLH